MYIHTEVTTDHTKSIMSDLGTNRRRSVISKVLDFFRCCRGDKVEKFNSKNKKADDIIVTRVFTSSSAAAFDNNFDITAGVPYIHQRNRCDIFNTRTVIGNLQIQPKGQKLNKGTAVRSKSKCNQVEVDKAAGQDFRGDMSEVHFDNSEGLEVLTIF